MNKEDRTPILGPLLLALKSRRVLVGLCILIVGILMMLDPRFASIKDQLLVLLVTVALAVIGGYSVEDAAAAGRSAATDANYDPALMARQIVNDILDALLNTDPSNTVLDTPSKLAKLTADELKTYRALRAKLHENDPGGL